MMSMAVAEINAKTGRATTSFMRRTPSSAKLTTTAATTRQTKPRTTPATGAGPVDHLQSDQR